MESFCRKEQGQCVMLKYGPGGQKGFLIYDAVCLKKFRQAAYFFVRQDSLFFYKAGHIYFIAAVRALRGKCFYCRP